MPISKNFIIKKVGNDYMIIPTTESNVNLSKIYNTNECGYFIYNKLKDGLTQDEVLMELLKEYNASEEELKADLHEFILELKKRGIYND